MGELRPQVMDETQRLLVMTRSQGIVSLIEDFICGLLSLDNFSYQKFKSLELLYI